ncbi:MAG TPA: GspE/PulE family protein [Blastocatellia bacterium]|jgi:type IV pilus assembly protein PilB|nr:GspE/PulE family protein [Blastocatellia bacterium]
MSEAIEQKQGTNGSAGAALPSGSGDARATAKSLEESEAIQLAQRYRLQYVDLGTAEIDYHLIHELPVELMVRYNFVPLSQEGNVLFVVMADPTDLDAIDELEAQLHVKLKIAVGAKSAVEDALKRGDTAARILQDATAGFRTDRMSLVVETEHGEEDLDLDRLAGDEEMSPIIKLVDTVVLNALERRASDIHIETRDADVVVKYRIDGALYRAADPIDIAHHQTIIQRIKVMSELDIAERRVPQDGRFRMRIRGRKIDFRVSIMPAIHGENAVIRILDKEQINESFRELNLDVVGFAPQDIKKFRKFIAEPYGMVLVTGPTGSGKTTSLYAALNEIKNDEDKIITIEDPVEYQLQGITQIPVNEKKGLTFARGLRSILRHDPDKIMVGEIRDSETAQIAIQSALTGHLVFTTVHANNVIDVIGRFLNMGVEAYNFVSSLNCVLAQRLVRMLCNNCRKEHHPQDHELAESGLNADKYRNELFYASVGCEVCNFTGYRGRTAIHELLDVTDHIREIILERRPGSEIRRAARAEGLSSLRESALAKVFAGVTTLHEINRVTFVE